jgi:transcriptional regulator with XRE-family HTH domain
VKAQLNPHAQPQNEFTQLLRTYRERIPRSRNSLAHEVGVDPSYLTRIELGARGAPQYSIIEAIARALHLTPFEYNKLLASAGVVPPSVQQLGGWNETLQAVIDVLNDDSLTPESRAEFSTVIRSIATIWCNQAVVAAITAIPTPVLAPSNGVSTP